MGSRKKQSSSEMETSSENKLDSILQQLSITNATINEMNNKFDSLMNKFNELEIKVKNNVEKICENGGKIERLEQYTRRNNLRIFGIKESNNENTDALVLKIISDLNVPVQLSDIERSHRIGKVSDKPRAIIVKFSSYRKRSEVFSAKKGLKGTGIVLKEDLTKYRLTVLQAAIAKYGASNVWTRDGRIFWKVNDKINSCINIENLN